MHRSTMTRLKVALVMLCLAALSIGFVAQQRWDKDCAAETPGAHWNGDDWLCEGNRR